MELRFLKLLHVGGSPPLLVGSDSVVPRIFVANEVGRSRSRKRRRPVAFGFAPTSGRGVCELAPLRAPAPSAGKGDGSGKPFALAGDSRPVLLARRRRRDEEELLLML